MECQSQMESLHDRRDKKLLTQRAKYKAQPTNKMHSRINDPNKGRLKCKGVGRLTILPASL